MFKKQKCNNCQEKVKDSYNFCPNCGIQLKDLTKDWGMLGKNDINKLLPEPKMLGGISGTIMNKMLGSAIKMLEKEMQKEMGNTGKIPKTKVKLMINGKEITPQETPLQKENKKDNTKMLPINFTDENLKKWSTLKRIEPKTNLKRIGDKIQYEMDVPGVEAIKDISIIKLEKSIEVKAIGKEVAYQKTIPIDIPLKKYSLLQGKLTLELDASM